jgi:Cu-Zn family superoxide dismutase
MRLARTIVLGAAGLLLAACGDNDPDETAASPQIDSAVAALTGDTVRDTTRAEGDTTTAAVAMMRDSAGRELGTVTVTGESDGFRLAGDVTGLPPGEHGFHVHAVGRCEPPFESAGPHWNPTNRQHGTQNPNGPHAGDLTGLTVGSDGIGRVNALVTGHAVSQLLDADGASLVVHAGADDYRTDPSGNSGARIACGEIRSRS